MAFGSAQQRFLAASTSIEDETPSVAGVLQDLADLLANPKKAAALVEQKLALEKARATAARAKEDMLLAQAQAEAGIDKARAEVARLRAGHDQLVAKREAELAAREKRAKEAEQQAVEHEVKAAQLRNEMSRRLEQMNRASQGAV